MSELRHKNQNALPSNAKDRKDIPLFWGLVNYFRDALIAVAKLSMIGNEQHCPGEPLHWQRDKGGDELDAQMRHTFEIGGIDYDLVPHSVKNAWRALATCQIELEETPWDTPVAEIVKLIRERRESDDFWKETASQDSDRLAHAHLEEAHYEWGGKHSCSRRPMIHMGRPDAPTTPDQAFADCQVIVLRTIRSSDGRSNFDKLKAFGPFKTMSSATHFAQSLRSALTGTSIRYVTLLPLSRINQC